MTKFQPENSNTRNFSETFLIFNYCHYFYIVLICH